MNPLIFINNFEFFTLFIYIYIIALVTHSLAHWQQTNAKLRKLRNFFLNISKQFKNRFKKRKIKNMNDKNRILGYLKNLRIPNIHKKYIKIQCFSYSIKIRNFGEL